MYVSTYTANGNSAGPLVLRCTDDAFRRGAEREPGICRTGHHVKSSGSSLEAIKPLFPISLLGSSVTSALCVRARARAYLCVYISHNYACNGNNASV